MAVVIGVNQDGERNLAMFEQSLGDAVGSASTAEKHHIELGSRTGRCAGARRLEFDCVNRRHGRWGAILNSIASSLPLVPMASTVDRRQTSPPRCILTP